MNVPISGFHVRAAGFVSALSLLTACVALLALLPAVANAQPARAVLSSSGVGPSMALDQDQLYWIDGNGLLSRTSLRSMASISYASPRGVNAVAAAGGYFAVTTKQSFPKRHLSVYSLYRSQADGTNVFRVDSAKERSYLDGSFEFTCEQRLTLRSVEPDGKVFYTRLTDRTRKPECRGSHRYSTRISRSSPSAVPTRPANLGTTADAVLAVGGRWAATLAATGKRALTVVDLSTRRSVKLPLAMTPDRFAERAFASFKSAGDLVVTARSAIATQAGQRDSYLFPLATSGLRGAPRKLATKLGWRYQACGDSLVRWIDPDAVGATTGRIEVVATPGVQIGRPARTIAANTLTPVRALACDSTRIVFQLAERDSKSKVTEIYVDTL